MGKILCFFGLHDWWFGTARGTREHLHPVWTPNDWYRECHREGCDAWAEREW